MIWNIWETTKFSDPSYTIKNSQRILKRNAECCNKLYGASYHKCRNLYKKKSIDMETKGHSLAHYFSRQTTIIRSWPLWYTKWPNLWRNLEGQF